MIITPSIGQRVKEFATGVPATVADKRIQGDRQKDVAVAHTKYCGLTLILI